MQTDNKMGTASINKLLLTTIMNATSRTYFQAFTSNDEIFSLCIEYMRICAFMQIPNMVHIAIQKMLQAAGNMIAPMWSQIAGVIVNIVFDPLLIFGIGPFPKLGIAGAAIATVMGFAFSMVLALFQLFNGKQAVQIESCIIRFDFRIIKNIFVCGFPSFILQYAALFIHFPFLLNDRLLSSFFQYLKASPDERSSPQQCIFQHLPEMHLLS